MRGAGRIALIAVLAVVVVVVLFSAVFPWVERTFITDPTLSAGLVILRG